jgi:uncharacterized protein (DUF2236 family)
MQAELSLSPAGSSHVSGAPTPDAGRPGAESITWRLHRERIVLAGWGRAILLQFAHPLVATAIAKHSTFRGGPLAPWRRLRSTVRAMLALTFGSDEEARAMAAHILRIHDRVTGVTAGPSLAFPAGQTYSAHDPLLLAWVHLTLLSSTVLAFEQTVAPLSSDETTRYCLESRAMSAWLGIPDNLMPGDAASLEAAMREAVEAPWLEVTGEARRLADDLLHPPLGWVGGPSIEAFRTVTIGWLPDRVRQAYGFAWTARDEKRLARWIRRIRRARALVPAALAHWGAARRAAQDAARAG